MEDVTSFLVNSNPEFVEEALKRIGQIPPEKILLIQVTWAVDDCDDDDDIDSDDATMLESDATK